MTNDTPTTQPKPAQAHITVRYCRRCGRYEATSGHGRPGHSLSLAAMADAMRIVAGHGRVIVWRYY